MKVSFSRVLYLRSSSNKWYIYWDEDTISNLSFLKYSTQYSGESHQCHTHVSWLNHCHAAGTQLGGELGSCGTASSTSSHHH